MSKILIADDAAFMRMMVKDSLTKNGYTNIVEAADGEIACQLFKSENPDLVILDITMPNKTGIEALRDIKAMNASAKVIMCSAMGQEAMVVEAIKLGALDFIVKPFDMKELSARIKAVLRRYNAHAKGNDDEVVRFENMEISLQKYELKLKGRTIDIPPKELELLYFLASNSNRVFTRDQLLDKVWGFDYLGDSRTVDVHVKRLREKLEGMSDKWTLKTVWGVGYKFETLI